MNSISVDNECFYSDHIIVRKPDMLTIKEMKATFTYALPHEFNSMKRHHRRDSTAPDLPPKIVLKPRKRSQSNDYEACQVQKLNMNDEFGKAIFEISGYKDDCLVGPLKIIRLPSQRSVPKTRKSIEFSSICPSPKGSIAPSIKDFGIGSEFCKLKVNSKVKSKK